MSGLCSSRVLTLGMRRRSLSSFRKRCWLLRAKSTAGEAMVSPFVLDNLNLGGHRGTARLDSEETNQYSAMRGLTTEGTRITEDFSGIRHAGASAPVRGSQQEHSRDQVWDRGARRRRRNHEVDAWGGMSGTHIARDDVQ